MMLLQELEGEQCELEMISGGCDPETHRRRFPHQADRHGNVRV